MTMEHLWQNYPGVFLLAFGAVVLIIVLLMEVITALSPADRINLIISQTQPYGLDCNEATN